jgi:hypothetical protein
VRHSHDYSVLLELKRYFNYGVLLAQLPELLGEFGEPEGDGLRFVKSGTALHDICRPKAPAELTKYGVEPSVAAAAAARKWGGVDTRADSCAIVFAGGL